MTTKTKTTSSRTKKRIFDYQSSLVDLKKNQLFLARLRGFQLSKDEIAFIEDPPDEIDYSATDLFNGRYHKTVNGIDHILEFAFQEQESGLSLQEAVDLIASHRDKNQYYTIIYLNLQLTTPARGRMLLAKNEIEAHVEFWDFIELLVNPFLHIDYNEHVLLTEEQIKKELPLASVEDEKKKKRFIASLQAMSEDLIVRWYNAKVGDIFRVERDSEFFDTTLPTYRVVRKVT